MRQQGIKLKFNPLPAVIAGKRLVVVDDSIVRGNTTRRSCRCCSTRAPPRCTCASRARRSCGRASTASTWPTAPSWSRRGAPIEEIAALTGADSLAYLSLAGSSARWTRPAEGYCRACFTGDYPIPVPDSSEKLRFETPTGSPAGA